ncbi:MAG TPA: hypothetical protein VFD37_05515 [Solirubrobacterales bacterium]|nr:hypothetical protein [Solirubrobacterales bacterium]
MALLAAFAALALWPSTAAASFHLMHVREVHAGSAENPGSQYVQLQSYARGQQFVRGQSVKTYDSSGVLKGTNTFASDVADGRNQMTILLATPAAESQFGVTADSPLEPGLDPAGGAVCFSNIDCVSWGSFSGSLASPAGAPAEPSGIPDGRAMRRTIEPNCPILLEAADDTNDSATDLFPAFPDPRPNSVAPKERSCTQEPQPPEDGGGGQSPSQPPGSEAGSGLALAAGLVPARAGRAIVRMRCFGRRGARCAGVLGLIARVVTRRGGRRVARRIVIGRARFNHPAGTVIRSVPVRLTRPGRLLLRRAGRRALRAVLTGRGLRARAVLLR